MRINRKALIAGQSSLKVRAFFKEIRQVGFFYEEQVQKYFKLNSKLSKKFIGELARLKYIKRQKATWKQIPGWQITTKAFALAMANAGAPLKRRTAEKMLEGFIERVKIVNKDPKFLLKVSRVILFGSFLSKKETLGDLDLAIELRLKESDYEKNLELREQKISEAFDAGKTFSDSFAQLSWPETEVQQFLKSRTRGLSLHPYTVHENFLKKTPHLLIFKE